MLQNFPLKRLAAVLLCAATLAGCGGGSAEAPPVPVGPVTPGTGADTTPPTVSISNNVSAATANGPVTFTFVFSEDVGTSFDGTDIVVGGGAASDFTRVDGRQATVVVTPAAGTTGTMTVSVAADRFTDIAGNANTAAASASKDFDLSAPTGPTTAPTTVVPANAVVIYSDATSVTGLDTAPNWGQTPPVVASEVTIAANKSLKYVFGGAGGLYQGIDWNSNPQNVSSKTTLHLDVFSPDITSVKVSIISAGKENAVTKTVTTGSWNAIDIDLAQYTVPDKNAIIQIKLEPDTAGTLYVDNVYFNGGASVSCGTTAPTCAPATVIPAGSVVIYSDATSVSRLDTAPNWSQSPPVVASEVTVAANKSLKYVFPGPGGLYQGLDWAANPQDVSTKATLHLDVWSADVSSIKVSLIGGNAENGITKTLTAGAWNSLDIPLSQYTSPDLSKIIQIKLEPGTAGTIYVDNIHFHGTASGSSGGSGSFSGGIYAADYQGNLGAGTAQSTLGGTVGFFLDPRLFANKAFEEGGVCGSTCNPAGVYNFYYGIGKTASPVITDGYFGGFVNAPGNGSADASAYAKVKLKFWGDAESWEKSNFTAQVDVILQGPTNAACTNPAGRPEIKKTVTAQKIGAGSEYVIAKNEFTLVSSCGGAYTIDSVWSAVGSIVVMLSGTNLQYVNTVPSTTVSYPTFINIGPISFIN